MMIHSDAKWVMVFDNVETTDLLLQYWPPAGRGDILVTTRNHNIAYEPAGDGIEVPYFNISEGSDLIMHLLRLDVARNVQQSEIIAATQLAEKLSGHALALSTMAGLIYRRRWSIREFLGRYEKDARRIHTKSLDAIWHLSFESLSKDSFTLLGIVSFLMPDSIPSNLLSDAEQNDADLPALANMFKDDDG
jgi:hypothetical protein